MAGRLGSCMVSEAQGTCCGEGLELTRSQVQVGGTMSLSNSNAKAELIGTFVEGFCYGEFFRNLIRRRFRL